jgi:tRNA(Arg) A34 adenosine deaminase TadA
MNAPRTIDDAWAALPDGARAALEAQWRGLAAGGLACGAAIVDARGQVVASGRNRVHDLHDPAGEPPGSPLRRTRIAHAEMNALAAVGAEADHASLTLWSTQRPCRMCAAALEFAGVTEVRCLAEDPSDAAFASHVEEDAALTLHGAHGDPLWWTVANLLFLHNPIVRAGHETATGAKVRPLLPKLADLAARLAAGDALGTAARGGATLVEALRPHAGEIARCVEELESAGQGGLVA